MGLIIRLAAFVALAGALYFIGNTLGHRLGYFELWPAWGRWSASARPLLIIGGVTLVLGLIGLFIKRPGSGLFAILAAGLVIACGLGPVMLKHKAGTVPPIHDITTDTVNPPEFVAVLPLRADAPNPPEYDPGQTAQQLEAYPDIETLRFDAAYGTVFDTALTVVQSLGLEIVAAEKAEGRIEATHTSRWWGFKDDVVIRIVEADGAVLVDIRSKSRIGGSDVGANAARIRKISAGMEKRLEG